MAVVAATLRRDHLTCPICAEVFSEPKTLPCMHSFCWQCLQHYICSQHQNGQTGFSCPICRVHVQALNTSQPMECWADQFITDFKLTGLLDTLRRIEEESVDTTTPVFCGIPSNVISQRRSHLKFLMDSLERTVRFLQEDIRNERKALEDIDREREKIEDLVRVAASFLIEDIRTKESSLLGKLWSVCSEYKDGINQTLQNKEKILDATLKTTKELDKLICTGSDHDVVSGLSNIKDQHRKALQFMATAHVGAPREINMSFLADKSHEFQNSLRLGEIHVVLPLERSSMSDKQDTGKYFYVVLEAEKKIRYDPVL